MLRRANAAIQRHPAHDFGIDEVLKAAADFPDAAIGFVPVRADMLDQLAHHGPQMPLQPFAVALKATLAPEQVNAIKHFSEDIHLFLPGSFVANAYGPGVAISTQMGEFVFDQFSLPPDAVHDLQVFAI